MELLYARCAGLDVHAKTVVASMAAFSPRRSRPARASSAMHTVSSGANTVSLIFIPPVAFRADTASTALIRQLWKTIRPDAATACTSCKRACTQREMHLWSEGNV